MARKKIIYIISPRSACSWNPGRKISSIISLWSKKNELTTFFGGDLIHSQLNHKVTFGSAVVHDKFYNRYKLLKPLATSYSELKDIIHNFTSYRFLIKNYKKSNFDIVWERSSRLHFAGLLYSKKYKLPYILEWKDNLINYKFSLFKFIAIFFEDYKCKQADKIVVESHVLKDYLAKKGYCADKIYVAHNAADAEVFKRNLIEGNHYRKEVGIAQSSIVVGYLGSYAFYHNSLLLLKAIKIIKDKNLDISISFLLVGDGLDYNKCRAYAEKHDLIESELIHFKSPVNKDEVPKVLSAVDISILPGSTQIISPIKILEYMANGTAVIVPNYPCNAEIVDDEMNGLLFNPNDEFDLADKIIKLAYDTELVHKLSGNGVISAKKEYSWDNTWGRALTSIIESMPKAKRK